MVGLWIGLLWPYDYMTLAIFFLSGSALLVWLLLRYGKRVGIDERHSHGIFNPLSSKYCDLYSVANIPGEEFGAVGNEHSFPI